jgi:hypothetical protein
MKNNLFLFSCLFLIGFSASAQYSEDYVEVYSTNIGGENYSIVKMSRKDERVKIKYFSGKDFTGRSVYERYSAWAKNKNIIALSSGAYMTHCDASYATPIGLCIDNGQLVNNEIANFDGLAIVYTTGEMAFSNLKDGDLGVTKGDGTKMTLNLNNSFDRTRFIKWAEDNAATVFQTHLLYFDGKPKVYTNGSQLIRDRQLIITGKDRSGEIFHFIVHLKGGATLYDATFKAAKFLQVNEDLTIKSIINVDPGCHHILEVRKSDGSIDGQSGFTGKNPISSALNLIVFYYE